MGIPLLIFLIAYFLLAGVFLLYAFFSLFHIVRFAHLDAASYFMTGIFVGGLILLIFVSYLFISPVDWGASIPLFSTDSFNPISAPTL